MSGDAEYEEKEIQNAISRYLQKWNQAKKFQTTYKNTLEEQRRIQRKEQLKRKVNQEMIITSNIEQFIQDEINNLEKDIEDWIILFDKDSDDLDRQIRTFKNDNEELIKECEELEGTIEKYEKEIGTWDDLLAEQNRTMEYEKRMNRSTQIVQSWWRGLLVRLEIGPFAPKKEKKNKKDKKKDKKKKK